MTDESRSKLMESQAVESIAWHATPSPAARNGVVTVGNFDGVHLGHAALLQQARDLARLTGGGPVTAITFDPHPLEMLSPERFQPPLTTVAYRAKQLRRIGVDAVVILRTTPDLLNLEPDQFFQRIIRERFNARGIVEGFNFRFGHDRAGTVDTLRELCRGAGIPLRVVEPFKLFDVTVSSSRVRNALLAGEIRTAMELMNRPYLVQGTVVAGARRGRTIGFPTANLERVDTLLPGDGVYAVVAGVGENVYPAAANVGPNPTFGDNARKVEVHLIGFNGDLYGQTLSIEFMERLRETRKFTKVDDLVRQMHEDVDKARGLIANGHANG
jgi:riboflavin kinase / FMN adenylyltransferase